MAFAAETLPPCWLWKNSFAEGRKGVTPLLRTKSPKDAGKTTDDDAVVAWAFDRANGGKSFTFTGGHLHATELFDEGRVVRPKALFAVVETLAREGHGAKRVCRLLRVVLAGHA